MVQKRYRPQHGWLHLPIGREAPRFYVKVEAAGRQIAELHLGLCPKSPDFYCGMALSEYAGQEILLTAQEGAPDDFLDGWIDAPAMAADHPLYSGLYKEALRPQYHFSSMRGWLNDPNGLLFDGETYHMYYQHNPYGITHGGVNIHWGHAVSKDAIRWTELPDAIRPDTCKVHIASGSAIIDSRGVAGYGKGTIIAAYTALGSADYTANPPKRHPSGGQLMAYSTDGGRTFTHFPDNPVIPTKDGKSWRDPRLVEMADGRYIIAVYETDEKGNNVTFYESLDLHAWTKLSSADDLYECPDLFPLKPENDNEVKWVLYGAEGTYRVGDFTDGRFRQIGGKHPLDYGASTYAGQTFAGRDDAGGRMHISWVRNEHFGWSNPENYPYMPFSQHMSIPCLLRLVKAGEEYRVTRNPIPAVDSLRSGPPAKSTATGCRALTLDISETSDTQLTVAAQSPVRFAYGSAWLVYRPKDGHVLFSSGKEAMLMQCGPLSLRLLVDRMSAEFFVHSEISATFGMKTRGHTLQITSEGDMDIGAERFVLRSIHP